MNTPTDSHPPIHPPAPAPWREAAREAMRQATLQELTTRYGTADVAFNYRWEHVQTVVVLARRLAELTAADADVTEAAAWLHDICKWSHGEDHPAAGAAFVRAFLPQTDFPPDKIEAVANAIAVHQGLYLQEALDGLEAQVLWDADKLAKIGLTAAFHWTGWALAGSQLHTMDDLLDRGRNAEWQAKTVASMHTEPARRAAASRLEAYNWLWATLEEELTGADLV